MMHIIQQLDHGHDMKDEVSDGSSTKHHARMPTFSRFTMACRRAGTAPPPLADDRVVPARGDGVFVAGLGFVEKAAAQGDVVDPGRSGGLVGGKEELGNVLFDLHGRCCWLLAVGGC